MPLTLEGGRIPPRWAAEKTLRAAGNTGESHAPAKRLRIALINNMPDSALEDTESQFFSLLESAAGDLPVGVKLFSLPGIPRREAALRHVNEFYLSTDELSREKFDGAIITGTEPRQPDMRDEPYWNALGEVMDWAAGETTSTVLSCLAAHASVLFSDGIQRHPLREKTLGVFAHEKVCAHPLLRGTPQRIPIPHSRWNEVRESELVSRGYGILTKSAHSGADMFVKQMKRSLFVHFQGHPEYGAKTLLKEYRRDIKRFLRRERDDYPALPRGYFDAAAEAILFDFQKQAVADPREERMAAFPEAAVTGTLRNSWSEPATRIYRNWLEYLALKKAEGAPMPSMVRAGHE
ncbi:MAG: homoserine O-succinyltransferase MetA [Candidatus Acidiferrales bacterium]